MKSNKSNTAAHKKASGQMNFNGPEKRLIAKFAGKITLEELTKKINEITPYRNGRTKGAVRAQVYKLGFSIKVNK